MTRGDRTPGPSRTLCPLCAGEIIPTELGAAEHRARHLKWARIWNIGADVARPSDGTLWAAYEAYAAALEQHARELRGAIADRDDIIAQLEDDLSDAKGSS